MNDGVHHAVHLSSTPVGFDEITPAWLTDTLRTAGVLEHGEVIGCRAECLPGVPSFTGSFRQLTLTYDERPSGAPESLVAKASTVDSTVRSLVHSMRCYERETLFYRDLAGTTPVQVPRCYFSSVDQDGRSLLLLEDLTAARPGRSTASMSEADAELAITTIARVHAAWWDRTELSLHPLLDNDAVMPADKATGTFRQHWPAFLTKLSVPVTTEVMALGDAIAERLADAIRDLFDQPPWTLVHHDYQGDNLIFDVDGPGTVRVIDWQLTARARGIIDVAYLLSGSLDQRQRSRTEHSLLTRYTDELAAGGVRDYPLARAVRDYRQALIIPPARLAMAVGSSPELTAHPGAPWDVLFARQLRAVMDHGDAAH